MKIRIFLPFLLYFGAMQGYSAMELIQLSLLNSPETQAAAQQWVKTESVLGRTRSDLYPKFSFQGSANHGRDYSFINGPMKNYTLTRAEIVLDYLLFDFGRVKESVRASRSLVAAALCSHDFVVQEVMIETLRAYFLLMRAGVNLAAELQSLEQTEELLQSTNELLHAGRKNKNDLLTLEVKRNDYLIRVKEKESEYKLALSTLNSKIGKPLDNPIPLDPLPEIPLALPLLETSQFIRSDLMARYETLQAKQHQLKATKLERMPTIKINGKSGAERYLRSKSEGWDYNFGVRLSCPIFDGYENIFKQQQEIAECNTEFWRIIELEREVEVEIGRLQLRLETAWAVFQIADKGEKTTQEMYDGAVELYIAGKHSTFDLISSQQTYSANMSKNELAKIDYFRALNELAYALGNLENIWQK